MFHLAHSRVILVTINDHLYISFSLEIDQRLDVRIQMGECEEYESGKRPHVTTGNTPHKPEAKRSRTVPNGTEIEIFQLLCVDKQTKSLLS